MRNEDLLELGGEVVRGEVHFLYSLCTTQDEYWFVVESALLTAPLYIRGIHKDLDRE